MNAKLTNKKKHSQKRVLFQKGLINITFAKIKISILTIIGVLCILSNVSYADESIYISQISSDEKKICYPGSVENKGFYINNKKEKMIKIDRLYISLKSCKYWKTDESIDINSKQFKELSKHSSVT